jgi:hypothetical protein
VPLAIFARLLQEHRASCYSGSIGFETIGEIAVRKGEDGSGRDETFKHHEGIFLGRTPDKPNILHGEVEQGASMLREVRNESSVEINETDEGLDLLLVGRGGPLRYTSYLHRVHFDLVV